MPDLYQKTKTMVSKANSKLKMIKGTIRDKNGVIIDENSFDTIANEIESIKIISSPNPDVISLISEKVYTDRYVHRSVTNGKTGISLVFFKDVNHDPIGEYGLINKLNGGEVLLFSMPVKEDGSHYTISDEDAIFAVYNYFFMRINKGDGSSIDFISEDGKKWDSDVAKYLDGYKHLDGSFFALTDQSISLLVYNPKSFSNDPYDLYELDFISKEMRLNEMYEGAFQYQNASIDNLSARTDNVYYSMPRTVKNGAAVTSVMSYSRVSDPFNHRSIDLGEELPTLFTSYKSMVRTPKNTLAIAAIDDGNKVDIIEVIFTINDSAPRISKRIIETNILMEEDVSFAVYQDVYLLATGSGVRWSYNMDAWYDLYTPDGEQVSDMTIDSKYIYIHTTGGKTITYTLALVTAADVPEGKVFLTHDGELAKGSAGNGYHSALRMGMISSVDSADKAFLNDTFTFDPREQSHAFNHIIHYGDEYLFAVGFLNHIAILRSRDGFSWTKGYESSDLNVNFLSNKFNKWHFEIYEGNLYFMQNNIQYSEARAFKVEVYPDRIELVENNEIFWNKTDIAENFNLFFINPVCSGLLYGYYEEDPHLFERLLIIDDYGSNVLFEKKMNVSQVVNIANKSDGAVIFTDTGFYTVLDERVYENSTNIAYTDFSTMKILLYKDILIILQRSFNPNIPFLAFYRLKDGTMTASRIEDMELPIEYQLFRHKPYLPIGDVCNNLLIIDDYNCKETAFIIDLEDKFRVVKYEDDTDMNRNKFIQYCNGKIFLINQFRKSKSIKTGNIGVENDWIDLAVSNRYYLTISADDQMVYCSNNGLDWKILEAYANDGKIADRIVAGGPNIAVAYTGESSYIWVSTDEGANWYQMWFPWAFWVQNVEMLHTKNGYELFIYAKLNEDDPYNIIYSSYDFSTWNETSITATHSNPKTNEDWRDITCSEDGVWVAIDSDSTRVITSIDGVLWEEVVMPMKLEWSSVIHTPNGFFVTARHSVYAAYSLDGKEWIIIRMPEDPNEMEKNYDWTCAAYGKINGADCIVALSNGGLCAIGPDIFNLELNSIPNREWKRIVFQDKKFVAIASNTTRAAYSYDGVTWYDSLLPTNANWIHLLYASGAFIAIDDECKNMATSITGITWLNEPVEDEKVYRFVDYRNDKFVVFQIEGTVEKTEYVYEYVGTSDTLREWISGTAYQNGLVFTSTDGVVINKNYDETLWNIKTLPCGTSETQWLEYPFKDSLEWTNICEGKGKKVILGINSDKGVWSSDGIEWETIVLPFEANWTNVVFVLNKFVVFAKGDSRYLTSYDGKSWTISELPEASDWIACVHVKAKVYLYSSSMTTYYVTNNLIAWKSYTREGRIWSSLTHDGSNFFAVVDGYASAYKSSDGLEWEIVTLGEAHAYQRICALNGKIFITARNSSILTFSEDGGDTWNRIDLGIENEDWRVVYIEDTYYLLGNETDVIFISTTGIGWDMVSLKYTANWIDGWVLPATDSTMKSYNLLAQNLGIIEYSYDGTYFYNLSKVDELIHGNGMFIAIDKALDTKSESTIYYSYDLLSWETAKPKLNGKILDFAYGDGKFMLITDRIANFAFESTDITHWTLLAVPTKGRAEKLIYGHNGFLILEDLSSGVFLFENSFSSKSYKLPDYMNPLVSSSGSVTVVYDMNTGKFYISHNNRESWTEAPVTVPLFATGSIKSVSLSDNLIYYADNTIYMYSIPRDEWFTITSPLTEIIGFEEITQMNESGNEKCILVYSASQIAQITNATKLTGEIKIDGVVNIDQPIRQVIENINQDGYFLLYEDGTIDGGRINVEYDGFVDNKIIITRIVKCDGLYLGITESEHYYLSYDFESWYRYTWPLDLVPKYLDVSQNHFIAILSNGFCDYFAASDNGKIFKYVDFEDTYGTEALIMTSKYNIFISKYGNLLDEIVIKEYYFLLNSIGKSRSKYDRVSPIRPAFAKGSFTVTEPNQDIKIGLNFTPSNVFVRSVNLGNTLESSQIVLSSDNIFHQDIRNDMSKNLNSMNVNIHENSIDVENSDNTRIVAFGFHVSPSVVGEYIYYAFN